MDTMTQPKIKGYRQLSEDDAALMNEIKTHGEALQALVAKVRDRLAAQRKRAADMGEDEERGVDERIRLDNADPERWASIGRTHFQEGLMALTRAVAQPSTF